MRSIFISYRRNDAQGEAGRLFDDLKSEFGQDSVFLDVAGLEPGLDFRKTLAQKLGSCGILLVLIGKSWLDARLEDPNDFVLLEVSTALKRDIRVVPLLVQGANMPQSDQLPDDLKDLAYRQYMELTHLRWESDIQVLIKSLRQYIGETTEASRDQQNSRYTKARRELDVIYAELREQFEGDQAEKLEAAQNAWAAFRHINAEFQSTIEGGTIARVIRMTVFADMTEARVEDLRKYLL